MKQNNLKLSTLEGHDDRRRRVPGGDRSRTLQDDFGVRVMHGWGMTEMSPVGTVNSPKAKHAALSADEAFQLSLKQGRPLFGVDMKIVDGEGNELPRDGKAFGNLLVKGPWVVREYYKSEGGSPLTADGWFPTGDVGDDRCRRLPADHRPLQGRDQVRRRVDQLDRSGEHRRRPSRRDGGRRHRRAPSEMGRAAAADRGEEIGRRRQQGLRCSGSTKARSRAGASPTTWSSSSELPHTATGKLSKLTLREQFKDHCLPTAVEPAVTISLRCHNALHASSSYK